MTIAYLYTMPNCKTCHKVSPVVKAICKELNIPLMENSLKDSSKKDLEALSLHGLPTLRFNDKEMYKDFTGDNIREFLKE